MKKFEFARRALSDLREIWEFVSQDNFDGADQLLEEFYGTLHQLSEMPLMGHKRNDLTDREVLFWPLHSYLVIYKPTRPLRIVRILHGRRDVRKLLKKR